MACTRGALLAVCFLNALGRVQAFKITMEHSASSSVLGAVGKWLDRGITRLMGPGASGPPSAASSDGGASNGPPAPSASAVSGPHSVGPPGSAAPKVRISCQPLRVQCTVSIAPSASALAAPPSVGPAGRGLRPRSAAAGTSVQLLCSIAAWPAHTLGHVHRC